MSDAPPGLFSIAPGRPFLRDLARGLARRFHKPDDPMALASATVFLPTRRAARTLSEELIAATGAEALVMPAIRVLGDVDEDAGLIDAAADLGDLPPEIGRLERDLTLAGLVDAFRRRTDAAGGFSVSLALARALGRLIDEAANEDVTLDGLGALAPVDLAAHWEKTVAFLDIVTSAWPAVLAERGRLDPAERRNRLIRAYAMALAAARPGAPFVIAGSSGSVKATADLMRVVAHLPNGAVVLNGLDGHMEAASWEALPPSHPQFALKELLIHLGVDRMAVGGWEGEAPLSPRAIFLSEAMRPPATADGWADARRAGAEAVGEGAAGLDLIEAANEREEALAIALAIREALETPGADVALVTADRMLARRVAAELRRWGVEADDSAGAPLAKSEAGALMALALEAAGKGGTPVALMSLLKHPRVTLGGDRIGLLAQARRLERRVLRPARITGGFEAIRSRLNDEAAKPGLGADERAAFLALVDRAEDALAPLAALGAGAHALGLLVAAHGQALEALTLEPDRARAAAWRGGDGEAAYQLMQDFAEAAASAPHKLTLFDYALAFDGAARAAAVRPQGARHPRVSIWGPLEARLHSASLMILGGLNEGVWPANPTDDPWLNRPMREALKLSAPERRIGLAAHDFAMLAAQPRVLLTRARRKDGAPSNPSRFLLRLMTLADGVGAPIPIHPALEIARRLDAAPSAPRPAPRPEPRPPVEARPRELSVTRIETWVRDPYSIYAGAILKLKKLDMLEQELDARDRGDMIHAAIEAFSRRKTSADDAYETLLACGRASFGPALEDADVRAFWWPRFLRAARWLAEQETAWAATRVASVIEERRAHYYDDIDFTLTGQPDRIDQLTGGGVRVIDYKTGHTPTKRQVTAFMAPQLPLLAAMARAGAFAPEVRGAPEELVYAQIGGGKTVGRLARLEDPEGLTDELEARLKAWVRRFDDPRTPYAPRRAMESMRYGTDYDHLSRFAEWDEPGADEA